MNDVNIANNIDQNNMNFIALGLLYGSNIPMMFYYCVETEEFYRKKRLGAPMEKVINMNEIRRLRMRLQNIMEV
jgi:hypothetical protein